MKMKKIISVALTVGILLGLFGCQKPEESGYGDYPVDKGYLYGMDYIAFEGVHNGIDYKKGFELMHNLGVQSMRNWMHVTWFFTENLERHEGSIQLMHDIIAEAEKYDIQLVGMSHGNFNKGGLENCKAKPARDLSEGSYYLEWLELYEESWRLLASEFTEITYWEIDNECNNIDFMPRLGGGTFSQRQMADIFTDMLFYASRGIHAGNPQAITVMGGITEPSGLGSGQNKAFLQLLYDNIASGKFGEGSVDPDDYFECAAWHPYLLKFDADLFVKYNDEIYQVILDNEHRHKKVFLTEVGCWTLNLSSQELAATYLEEMYRTVESRMPYVEAVHYFRAFDNVADNNNNSGIFYDPNPNRIDNVSETGKRANPGAPKPAAYAFQRLTGATGDLTILETKLND